MQNVTREKFNRYLDRITKLNSIDSANHIFTVEPSVQQRLETRIQESSEFLRKINVIGVPEIIGEKLGLGTEETIASRTDTENQERTTKSIGGLNAESYKCEKTNFDTDIKYSRLDQWAKFRDFQKRLRDIIIHRQALDRIMIGFNGTSVAKTTQRTQNKLLQDVNIGWLEKYRLNAAQRVLKEVADGSNKVEIGESVSSDKGYKNLDAMVFDAVNNLIEPWYQDHTDLVCICGREVLADKYFTLINQNYKPTDIVNAHLLMVNQTIGNLPAYRVPFFPKNAILITSFENLSLYYQESGRRRYIRDNPARDRIENFESSNDAYVVEDYGMGCLIENIEIKDK